MPPKRKRPPARPIKYGVKTGDQVRVLAGEWKDAEGAVRSVDRVRGRVVVEGVNMTTRHMRKSQQHPEGGVVEQEAPIHISNVRVIETE
ncbi:50S ribosomal protein L24 [Candidatus Poribacteria bacterium]|nr:50S ribosomal protein L24 [Candidatus Poribacteria bacterium]MBT5533915.1 50S ribosomal protein L24 [Candidatus Poribacteria bacterium]MBT5711342.1 50S ribosomal protein L24 [Candidatus Poribacteria bacterium]MBT7097851.1 50S ribosomal protein L24 [Candidatus Poribacteria bacterium]MBT7806640.1 50S ribosomal protein L24 [Candidatus Poribacteria bacterium]